MVGDRVDSVSCRRVWSFGCADGERPSRVLCQRRFGVSRAPLMFFESQRWRLYERGQASCLEVEAVGGVRNPMGGRCRVWYARVNRTPAVMSPEGRSLRKEAGFVPTDAWLRLRGHKTEAGRRKAACSGGRWSRMDVRSPFAEVQPKAMAEWGERSRH
jgi:hypothetical protein